MTIALTKPHRWPALPAMCLWLVVGVSVWALLVWWALN